jgi:hypothetical protein
MPPSEAGLNISNYRERSHDRLADRRKNSRTAEPERVKELSGKLPANKMLDRVASEHSGGPNVIKMQVTQNLRS